MPWNQARKQAPVVYHGAVRSSPTFDIFSFIPCTVTTSLTSAATAADTMMYRMRSERSPHPGVGR